MPKEVKQVYIGDGVYARWDGMTVLLETEREKEGEMDKATVKNIPASRNYDESDFALAQRVQELIWGDAPTEHVAAAIGLHRRSAQSAILAATDNALVAQSLERRESSPGAEGSRSSECICPTCGIRHAGAFLSNLDADFA